MRKIRLLFLLPPGILTLSACGVVASSTQQVSSGGNVVPSGNVGPLAGTAPSDLPKPTQFDNQTGVLHHTGGPYISSAVAATAAATTLGCASPNAPQTGLTGGGACSGSTVRFYPSAAAAFAANPDWGVASIGQDREVYFVTIHGRIKFFPKTMSAQGNNGVSVDHFNVEIDATTGDVIGSGTAGSPLE